MKRYRRHPALLVWWEGEEVVFHNFVRGTILRPEAQVFDFLNFFHTWRTVTEAREAHPQMPAPVVGVAMERLASIGILEEEGAPEHPLEKDLPVLQWDWPLPVQFFHVATRDLPFATTPEQVIALQLLSLKTRPHPPIFVTRPELERIALPRRMPGSSTPLDTALLRRKTVRQYLDEEISKEQLSRLLFLTWGTAGCHVDAIAGPLIHRTAPSGGSKHSIEVYCIVSRVRGLDPGIYHYATEDHSLERVRKGEFGEKVAEITACQTWIAQAAVVFVMTARIERVMWKYPYARSYRALFYEAGHLCQNMYLNAWGMGLGAFTTIAYTDTELEALLGVDGNMEPALYVCGAGVPDPEEFSSLKMAVEQAADGTLTIQDPLWQPPPFTSPYVLVEPEPAQTTM